MNYCKLLSEVYVLQIYGNAITIIEIYWRGKISDFIIKKNIKEKFKACQYVLQLQWKVLEFPK